MSRHPVALARYALVAAVAVLFALAPPALAQDDPSPIPSGPTTVDQAVAWSQATFANGSAPTVLLARDDVFPDALGSGAAQARLQAPLLLTNTDILSPQTAAEITRLGAETVIVLGGEEAVAPTVVTALEALGVSTERVAGATRAETAAAIVERFFPNTTAVVVGRADAPSDNPTAGFADMIALGGYSSAASIPVLLTNNDQLLPETMDALASLPLERVLIAGGTAAINESVATQIGQVIDDGNADTDETVERLSGAARDVTAIAINADLGYETAGDAPRVILVEGFAEDAWAPGFASAIQAGNGAATVIANGEEISQATTDYLTGAGVPLVCGPGTSDAACDAAADAINS